jgi:hypothetical protein
MFAAELSEIKKYGNPLLLKNFYSELGKIKDDYLLPSFDDSTNQDVAQNDSTCSSNVSVDRNQLHEKNKNVQKKIVMKTSDVKYHDLIDKDKHNVVPKTYAKNGLEKDVNLNIQHYLKSLFTMNKLIQNKGLKSNQFFPIRATCRTNYVKINSSAFVDLFYDDFKGIDKCKGYRNKTECFHDVGNDLFKEIIWTHIFSLCTMRKKNDGMSVTDKTKWTYTRPGYEFNYEIETDGYCVSIGMIKSTEVENKKTKCENRAKCRRNTITLRNSMSKAAFDAHQLNKKTEKLEAAKRERERLAELSRFARKNEIKQNMGATKSTKRN